MMRSIRIIYNSRKTLVLKFNKDVTDCELIFFDCHNKEFYRFSIGMLNDEYEYRLIVEPEVTVNRLVNDWHNDHYKFWELWVDGEKIERGLLYIDKTPEGYSLPIDFEL